MLKGIGISKSFGSKKILDGVNIEITPGEVTVVAGPSGCGKTTLLRCLSLLDNPDKGEIVVDDLTYSFPDGKNKNPFPYPKITVVYQQLFLWPHLTNKQNITLAVENSDYKGSLAYLTDYFDMKGFIDNYPNQSSLGQKQRIAIARALILEPDYILFDEITSSLDTEQIDNIIEIIRDLKKKEIGIFFITHNLNVAENIGDQTIHLKQR